MRPGWRGIGWVSRRGRSTGRAGCWGLAWVATFVLAFGEFELASLMVRPAWTVWLFDAQVVGLGLGESLRYAMWPAGVSLVGVALAVMLGVAAGGASGGVGRVVGWGGGWGGSWR